MSVYNIAGNTNTTVYHLDGGRALRGHNVDGAVVLNSASDILNSFSILGDSYSTFAGHLTPDTNSSWYPTDGTYGDGNDVTTVEQTWWYMFKEQYALPLTINNSHSGSTVSYDGYGDGTVDGKTTSFIQRAGSLGSPGLIPALAYLLDNIKSQHPSATVVFILNHAITPSFKESAKTICEHMSVPCVELNNIAMTGGHPNSAGMVTLSNQVINFMDKLSI